MADDEFRCLWEMDDDEEDWDEFTQEEIENDPRKRILWATEKGHLDIVKSLLEVNPSLIQVTDSDNYTPLHRAAYSGNTEITKVLLSKGADVNARTLDGWQPLHSACKWNNVNEADLLLQNGADPNAQTNGGLTPLYLAVSENNHETMILLLTRPFIQPGIQNNVGETALQLHRRLSPLTNLFDWCNLHAMKLH